MTELHTVIVQRRALAVLHLLAVGSLAVMLAGCYETSHVAQAEYPTDYLLRHPITLKEGDRTVEIFLGRNRGGLSPSQRADVLSFAQLWRHEGTSGIIVDVPQGGPNDRAAADSMREVHSILAASGVPGNAVYMRSYRPPATALASIKISYSKLTAAAGPCGLWPHDLGPSNDPAYAENRPYWNFGCSSQRNLAAMVDNPADLVQPRGETPAYAARRSVMMDKYRKGDSPSATYPNDSGSGYQSGKVSDVGK
jgi:pilus assembly protein CpaD